MLSGQQLADAPLWEKHGWIANPEESRFTKRPPLEQGVVFAQSECYISMLLKAQKVFRPCGTTNAF
jgi:hypothetical protein